MRILIVWLWRTRNENVDSFTVDERWECWWFDYGWGMRMIIVRLWMRDENVDSSTMDEGWECWSFDYGWRMRMLIIRLWMRDENVDSSSMDVGRVELEFELELNDMWYQNMQLLSCNHIGTLLHLNLSDSICLSSSKYLSICLSIFYEGLSSYLSGVRCNLSLSL